MTRSSVKREALDEFQATAQQNTRQSTTELPERSSSQRAMSIISITSQAPEPQPNGLGDTTIPDGDAEMTGMSGLNGAAAHQNCNGISTNGARVASAAPTLDGDEEGDIDSLVQDSLPFFELSQHLERLGIANTLPSLPKATLVGDQNHGKSSVGEALSGISFPREEGTCTRAPFEVTVSPAEPGVEWEATIRLLIKYDYTPKTKARDGYAGWTERTVPWTITLPSTRDKEQAASILQDAQLAILNPPYEYFSGGNCPRPAGHVVGFTPNVVQVHVKRRTKLSLSFIDLPGLVHRLKDKEQYLVELLRKLVINYIQQPNALILLTHQSDIDLATTQAYDLVVKAGAQSRCIGILTKPDKSEDSNARMEIVHSFLRGEVPLGGKDSWFVTKQLSSNAVAAGVSHAQARAMEQEFFSRSPWADKWANFESRFGTPNLARAISVRLRDHIQLQLPDMLGRVQVRLEEVEAELQTFPKPSDSPIHTVQRVIEKVAKSIADAITGDGLDNEFSTKFDEALVELKFQLEKAARPNPVLRTPGYESPIVDLAMEESEEEQSSPSKRGKSNAGQPFSTPQGRSRLATLPDTPPSRHAKSESRDTPTASSSFTRADYRLDEIRDMMKRFSNRSIPVQVHPRVTVHLIKKGQQPWPIIVEQFLKMVWKLLSDTLNVCVSDNLPPNTTLRTSTSKKLREIVLELWNSERDEVRRMVQREMMGKVTQNTDLIKNAERNEGSLLSRRLKERLKEHFETMEHNAKSKQDASKVPKTPEARMSRRDELEPDEYSREVKAMAEPIAYYLLSAARLVDSIAVRLNSELLVPIENNTLHELQDRMGASDEAACIELLAEDPEREGKRKKLIAEREHLVEAGKRLELLLHGEQYAMQ